MTFSIKQSPALIPLGQTFAPYSERFKTKQMISYLSINSRPSLTQPDAIRPDLNCDKIDSKLLLLGITGTRVLQECTMTGEIN